MTRAIQSLNSRWARAVVAGLVREGVTHFFISPGNRNFPLIEALEERTGEGLVLVSCMDERAAAFRALGFSKAQGQPACLISTSGTAACNYYPAVVEASKEDISMLILTADRPFELTMSSANQVIDQALLFDGFLRHRLTLPEPGELPEAKVISTLVRQAVVNAQTSHGPVHINVPFRDPVGPLTALNDDIKGAVDQNSLSIMRSSFAQGPRPEDLDRIVHKISRIKKGLLVIGRLPTWRSHPQVAELAARLGWPVYSDLMANVGILNLSSSVLDPCSVMGRQWLENYHPDGVLHLGRRLVTKHFDEYFSARSDCEYMIVSEESTFPDVTYQATELFQGDEEQFCSALLAKMPLAVNTSAVFQSGLSESKAALAEMIRQVDFSTPQVVDAVHRDNRGSVFFIGNSSSIRSFDTWSKCSERPEPARFFGNRGVSGIEGNIATALGIYDSLQRPVVMFLGDVSAIHDLNSLLMLAQSEASLCVVVFNDQEGGIFRRLRGKDGSQRLSPLIMTPHSFDFSGIAQMAGLSYDKVSSLPEFERAYDKFWSSPAPRIIECKISGQQEDEAWDRLLRLT